MGVKSWSHKRIASHFGGGGTRQRDGEGFVVHFLFQPSQSRVRSIAADAPSPLSAPQTSPHTVGSHPKGEPWLKVFVHLAPSPPRSFASLEDDTVGRRRCSHIRKASHFGGGGTRQRDGEGFGGISFSALSVSRPLDSSPLGRALAEIVCLPHAVPTEILRFARG